MIGTAELRLFSMGDAPEAALFSFEFSNGQAGKPDRLEFASEQMQSGGHHDGENLEEGSCH
jgi:hypothetical protein